MVFQQDEVDNPDEATRKTRLRIGLADLANGIELKNLHGASTDNTIAGHISNYKKEVGATFLVLDFTENQVLNDKLIEQMVSAQLAKKYVDSALVLFPSGRAQIVRKRVHPVAAKASK